MLMPFFFVVVPLTWTIRFFFLEIFLSRFLHMFIISFFFLLFVFLDSSMFFRCWLGSADCAQCFTGGRRRADVRRRVNVSGGRSFGCAAGRIGRSRGRRVLRWRSRVHSTHRTAGTSQVQRHQYRIQCWLNF